MLQKIRIQPGFNKQVTATGGEGQWVAGDYVRFRYGTPEKIGGWAQLGDITLTGRNTALHHFVNSDGAGPFIASWNVSGLAEPTAEQLATYESAATTKENNNITRGIRRNAYGDIGDQLDLIYKDIVAGKLDTSGEWAKKVKAVKDANEKE